ncbi:hypothetical protein FN846DRAFT_986794 [Sphaerosporella brunnea]|uniref:Uncharacterized protein n=1 Tax=Sphaerosporella brunnea TaxID=1250544 RepID=A0A5J5ESI0_9PEZI|nr:hypothetical protein FN846DRAFT_986794 [Sphaerosporella brunnea]
MPDTRARTTKRARSTEDAQPSKKMRAAAVRLPLYKDHNWMCEHLGIPPRDKLASLIIRREVQDLCKQHGFELTRKYSTWGAKAMRRLVNTVTAQLNADPRRKKVIPTAAVDALVHRLCLDNVRNMRVAQEKKSKGDSYDDEEDPNSKDEEGVHTSSDEDTPAAPTEPPYAQQKAVETDMDNEDGQDEKEFRHFGAGKWSVNESHTEIDEQLSNLATDMTNGDLNGETRLAEAHDHEMRLPPSVRAKCDDETRRVDNGRESRSCERNPGPKPLSPAATVPEDAVHISLPQTSQCAPKPLSPVKMPLLPVGAKFNDDIRSMNNGCESRPGAPSPGPKPLSPAATVPEDAVDISLPQTSQCTPKPLSPVKTPLLPVGAQFNDDIRSMNNGCESRPGAPNPGPEPLSPAATVPEDAVHISPPQTSQRAPKQLSPVKMPLLPVGAKFNDDIRSMNNGCESRPGAPSPGPEPLSPPATVPEDALHISLPQTSQCAPKPLSPVKMPLLPVGAKFNDDIRSMNNGCESRPGAPNPGLEPLSPAATVPEDAVDISLPQTSQCAPKPLSPVKMPLLPVGAKFNDDIRSMNNGCESRPGAPNPGPEPLSPPATVPEDAVHISLATTSQCDTRTSILVHFGNESPSNPPVVIPRARPWHMLYLSMTRRVPCNFLHVRLGAIVPETTEMVYLDSERAWKRLTGRREVVRLILVLVPRIEDISLPQASQYDTLNSILVHFGNESPSNPPVVIPRAQPFINLYLSMSERVPSNDEPFRLGAIVPATTEMVYLDTEEAWERLTSRLEVVRLMLLLMPHTE